MNRKENFMVECKSEGRDLRRKPHHSFTDCTMMKQIRHRFAALSSPSEVMIERAVVPDWVVPLSSAEHSVS
jgi:hypothetical protein